MMDIQERRAKGSSRVALETLVEICGNEPGIPAFEAEALDVSARGMHLRTAYLPEEGAPLVCRFEDRGREIVVEGLVAWRKESAKGGDFGVSFTALDSRSVEALKTLLKTGDGDGAEPAEQSDGSRVRLHIEGLGSPMKARVRGASGTQKIQVGSSLEFLKVGRRLEVEDVEAGSRRAALIDGVEVLINPKTSVPQLVVALRYEGAGEDTPEPTTTSLSDEEPAPGLRLSADKVTTDAGASSDESDPEPSGDQPEASTDEDDDLEAGVSAATRTARKLGAAAENAGVVARDASAKAARWGAAAFQGLGKALGGKLAGMRKKPSEKRRTTAPAPEGPMSSEGRKLRPQSGKSESPPAPGKKRPTRKHVAIGAAAAVLLGTVGAMALRGGESAPTAKAPNAAATGAEAAAAAPATPMAVPVTPSLPGGPVTANVPLFGPTPLATLEPAPLGPPPTGDAAEEEALELAAAKAATPPEAEDEEFVDGPGDRGASVSKKAGAPAAKPEDVAPFGNGRMHLPTISRLRLDGPGAELRGQADATGFTVLIPGRKVMEQGAAIAKRDPRIARIRTTNTPGGAQVRLTFKDGVPAYRVRLRRDFVELLISAPEEKPKKVEAKAASKAASKSIPAVKTAKK